MNKRHKQIAREKKKEVKDIRRGFDDEMLKTAAFSVGREFRSIEVYVETAEHLLLLVEIKSRLFIGNDPDRELIVMEGFDPLRAARSLIGNGLESGVIVSTDSAHAGGDISWLNLLKTHTNLPIVQRDFFIDPVQIYRGKAVGADAVLIDTAFTPTRRIAALIDASIEMGMEVFIEVHHPFSITTGMADSATGVVINLSRDAAGNLPLTPLATVVKRLPQSLIKFVRSYPRSPEELAGMRDAGIQGIVLTDELWRTEIIEEEFRRIHSWCTAVRQSHSPGRVQ